MLHGIPTKMNMIYMSQTQPVRGSGGSAKYKNLLTLLALVLVVSSPGWLYLLFFASAQFDYSSALLQVPPILIIQGVLVAIASRRDGFLRRVMLVGTLAKLACASIFLYMAFHVYDASVDSLHYFDQGRVYIGAMKANGGFLLLQPFWSNNFIYMLSGLFQSVVGYDLQTTMVFFALISFWGEYFCYRAFCAAAPLEDRSQPALLLFLLPSLVFWSAPVGKDSVMLLFIGIAAFGLAKLSQEMVVTGVALSLFGIAGVTLVRPHVALMIAAGFAVPFLLGPSRKGVGGMMIKVFGLPLLAAVTLYLAFSAQEFLQIEDFSQSAVILQKVGSTSNFGGSAFGGTAGPGQRILATPVLFFRPFPWEVHNGQSAVAAVEGSLLAFLVWKRRKQLSLILKNLRENPFVFFALVYVVEFSIIFSAAISNFGLLARQRVMATPFLIMLLCVTEVRHERYEVRLRQGRPMVDVPPQIADTVTLPAEGS